MKTKTLVLFAAITLAIFAQIYLASALTINSASTTPSEVQPGDQFKLGLTVENNLPDDAENVIVSLVLNSAQTPFAPYQSSNEDRVDEILSDDSEKMSFDLTVLSSAVSGTYTVPVEASYTIGNGTNVTHEDLGVVSVIVNAKPSIDVSLEDSPLILGTKADLKVKIVNSGLGDAKFLSVSIGQARGIQVTGTDSSYIGDISSNDFDTADFSVFVSADAPSIINLPVEVTYSDSRNNQITVQKTISVESYTTNEAVNLGLMSRNNTGLIIGIIIVGIIGIIVYRAIRKRIRNNKSKKEN
ncbi:MAG TPA: hypothetical protein VMC07_01160 [Candidatus Omnitrophota bacterium]|nr:hypothetical protein [Candidatus Omnitrophota bacterium]